MNAVTRSEAQAWVNTLLETPSRRQPKDADEDEVVFLSGATVRAVASLMRTLYASAVKESPPIVLTNPFADLSLPPASSQTLTWFEHDEVTALLEAVKDDAMAATLFELGCTTGLRVGELLALRGDRVDWLRGRVSVVDVQTKAGLKTWPKTDRSRRTVPVPNELLKRMSKLMEGRPRESLVFTAPRGGALDVDNLRERLWYPAVEKAGVRRYPPRAMRHTAASHLVMDGVPLIDVRDLLGHTSIRVTERYAHLRPDAHEKVVQSWARRSS